MSSRGAAAVALAAVSTVACTETRSQDRPSEPGATFAITSSEVNSTESAAASCAAPSMEGDVCARDGRLQCDGERPACPPHTAAPVTMGFVVAPYVGSSPKCAALPDPLEGRGLSLIAAVDVVEQKVFPLERGEQFETWVHLTRTDVAPKCGFMVNFRSLSERPRLQPGTRLQLASRSVQRAHTELPGINVVTSEAGRVLYALVLSAPVARFAEDLGDLVPGLRVTTSTHVVCTGSDGSRAFSLELSTGTGTCRVESQTSRCCTLWNRSYEVEALNVSERLLSSVPEVAFTLRAKDFFYRPE